MARGELDTASGVPLYRQIKDILRAEIATGDVDATTPMTEAQLLDRFGVSRAPIRQALKELADEGYVYRRQGKGTFPVPGVRVDRPADIRPGDLTRYLSDQGLHPTSVVSGVERELPSAEIRGRLGLDERERLLRFTRLISVEGRPIAEAVVHLRAPDGFAPTAAQLEEAGSAFALIEEQFGIALDRSEHEAWADAATSHQAQALGVAEGSPLLIIDTTFYATGGLPAGWRSAAHIAGEFKFHFTDR